MANSVQAEQLRSLLTEVGRRNQAPARLYLLGGSALLLLGSERPTLDLDYYGDDTSRSALQQVIETVATEMRVDVDAVPIDDFIPLDPDVERRHIYITSYNNLEVYAFDPYSICISKLDRGFDSDLDDIVYLVRSEYVDTTRLASMVDNALDNSVGYDMNPNRCRRNLEWIRSTTADVD